MDECNEIMERLGDQGSGLESDTVLYALGLIQSHPVPAVKYGVEHNLRRGPKPRKLDLDGNSIQRCYVCKEEKKLTEYSADCTRPNGVMSRCKKCNNQRVTDYAKSPKGRARHRRYQLKRVYGITPEIYEEMVIAQNDLCAICNKSPQETQRGQFYVDHNHTTDKIRGLLCGKCNSALGMFCESEEILTAAIRYVKDDGVRSGTVVPK